MLLETHSAESSQTLTETLLHTSSLHRVIDGDCCIDNNFNDNLDFYLHFSGDAFVLKLFSKTARAVFVIFRFIYFKSPKLYNLMTEFDYLKTGKGFHNSLFFLTSVPVFLMTSFIQGYHAAKN